MGIKVPVFEGQEEAETPFHEEGGASVPDSELGSRLDQTGPLPVEETFYHHTDEASALSLESGALDLDVGKGEFGTGFYTTDSPDAPAGTTRKAVRTVEVATTGRYMDKAQFDEIETALREKLGYEYTDDDLRAEVLAAGFDGVAWVRPDGQTYRIIMRPGKARVIPPK